MACQNCNQGSEGTACNRACTILKIVLKFSYITKYLMYIKYLFKLLFANISTLNVCLKFKF